MSYKPKTETWCELQAKKKSGELQMICSSPVLVSYNMNLVSYKQNRRQGGELHTMSVFSLVSYIQDEFWFGELQAIEKKKVVSYIKW